MIEVIALVLFLAVLVAMMVAPGSSPRGRTVPAGVVEPVDGSVAQTA